MINICFIFGGTSSEYEVSLRSVGFMLENIDRDKYNVHTLGITKDGRWLYYSGPASLIASDDWHTSRYARPATILPERGIGGITLLSGGMNPEDYASSKLRHRLLSKSGIGFIYNSSNDGDVIPVDVVFPVLHGKFGEDGTVQGLLELAGIPYVGCGVLASAACMDKHFTHIVLESAGIKMTGVISLTRADVNDLNTLEQHLSFTLGYPMFIKPANAGSSVGVCKVNRPLELENAINEAFKHDTKIVAEQMAHGREIECAVMGNSSPVAAGMLGEIAPSNEFYDYAGKYLDDSTQYYVPARISEESARRVREIAVKAYSLMGCRGLARIDFFVSDSGDIILNEINTIPGFTTISMFPRLFREGGLPYPKLIDALVAYALEYKQ